MIVSNMVNGKEKKKNMIGEEVWRAEDQKLQFQE